MTLRRRRRLGRRVILTIEREWFQEEGVWIRDVSLGFLRRRRNRPSRAISLTWTVGP